MEASSNLVIKVKYGDMLRRFTSAIVGGEIKLGADGLRQKIIALFNLDTNAELVLTYVDEDGDVVTLVDDDDVHDAVKQALNPLRITAKLCCATNSTGDVHSTGSSTPGRSPRVKPPVRTTNTGISGLLRNLPEPAREMLVQISTDLASKASGSSSNRCAAELVDYYIKLGMSYLDKHLDSRSRVQLTTDGAETEGSVLHKDSSSNTNGNTNISELLKDLPESLQKMYMSFNTTWASLISSVFSSTPGHTVLEDYYKQLGLFFMEQSLLSQNKAESSAFNSVIPRKDSSVLTKNSKDDSASTLEELSNLITELSKKEDEAKVKVDGRNPIMDSLQSGDNAVPNPAPAPAELGVPHTVDKGKAKVVDFCPYVNSQLQSPSVPSNAGKVDGSCIASSGMPSVSVIKTTATGNEVDLNDPDLGGSDPMSGEQAAVGGTSTLLNDFREIPVWATHLMNDARFSGIATGNVPLAPPIPASVPIPFSRSVNHSGKIPNVFHHGVRCDGCGIYPIAGPRYKSKVMADYDLCSTCFAAMGNNSNYFRLDYPMPYRGRASIKNFPGPHRRQNLPQVYKGCKVKSASKLDSRFVVDVNVLDGTVIPPSTPFTKIWRMKNNGVVGWPRGTQLVWIGGDKLSNALSVELEIPASTVLPKQELDVAVDFISPELPGRYTSYWKMSSPSGQKFGQRVWVLIQVENAINEEAPPENIRNLNLNLPPVSSSGPEIINVNPEPTGAYDVAEPNNSKVEELVQPNTDPELKFPINDSLLVGNGASSSTGPSVSYPIIDLSDVPPPLIYRLPPPMAPTAPILSQIQPKSVDVENEMVEETLLQELNKMGFKQLDLNKEVLRMNEYDIEQSVADLCDVTEWDPMLEELEEMGFYDRETNKKLLMKNNGSIKRVVMDLIADEMY